MKNPAAFVVAMMDHHFIYDVKIANGKIFEPAEHFIVVTGNVIHFYTTAKHAGNLLDYLHVPRWPIFFTKLPDINNISI